MVTSSPLLAVSGQVIYDGQNWNTSTGGVDPAYQPIQNWQIAEGTWFDTLAEQSAAPVAVLGQTVVQNLFAVSATDPIGQTTRINSQLFHVTGKGVLNMNSFFKGVLVGAGIGLLVAPMKGEELRGLLRQRFEELCANLPENEQLSQYTQQVSNRVSQTSSALKDYAQQAATKVQSTASDLKDLAQQAGSQVKQTGQDVIDTTKQAASSAKPDV